MGMIEAWQLPSQFSCHDGYKIKAMWWPPRDRLGIGLTIDRHFRKNPFSKKPKRLHDVIQISIPHHLGNQYLGLATGGG
jgi:hypothetical protein